MKYIFIVFLLFVLLIKVNPMFVGELEQEIQTNEYRVIIPRIQVDTDICTSGGKACLDFGVWMKYFDYDGNILLTGHSFTLLPFGAGVFYALSELEVGDRVYIFLDLERVYIIENIFITDRFNIDVENFNETENSLVIYSCYPLWSASQRIVVKASLCDLCEYEL